MNPQAGDDGAAEAVVSTAELAGRRADGMRGKVAPLLRGEGGWRSTATNLPFATRILACADSLLADVPFWFEVRRFHALRPSRLITVCVGEQQSVNVPSRWLTSITSWTVFDPSVLHAGT